ncbi:MAG: ChaN family lipoprotein, partial [Nitrospinaceae bacterium]
MFFSRILAAGFLWVLGTLPVQAQDCAVPNQGSPYQSLAQLKEGQILHLPTGVLVTADQLIDTVAGSRVVYIGETHDNLEAHRVQLEIIRKLLQRHPGKVAVGMEMFRQSAQPQLQAWREGRLSRQEFNKLFRKNWGSGFRLYAPIIDFIQAQNIPLLALKSTKAMESRLRQGGPGQPGLPEIDFDDPYHRAYAMALFGANEDHAPEAIRPYQMLLLWEEAMAEAVAGFLNDPRRQDWTLVVLAGGFHVQYGHGIPKRAFRRHPHGYSIILPAVTE